MCSDRVATAIPLPAAGGKVFYGWWIVVCAVVGLAFGASAISLFTFGVFVRPLELEFGWTRGELSLGVTTITCMSVLLSPLHGLVIDRFGVRRTLIPSILLFGLGVMTMSTLAGSIWQFYGMWALITLVGIITWPMSYSRALVAWFDRQRGLAIGVGLAGVGLGTIILPVIAQSIIAAYGWRMAYIWLGGLVLVTTLPLIALRFRDTPAELGLQPDGETDGQAALGGRGARSGFTFRQSVRLPSFWCIVAVFFLVGGVTTAMIQHQVPMLIDRGISPQKAAFVQSAFGFAILVGRIAGGYLMDRLFAPHVAIAFFIGPVLGLSFYALGATGELAYLSAALVGLAVGAEFDLISYLTSRYFGQRSFGALYGIIFSAFQLGSGLAAAGLGFAAARFGGYSQPLWVLVGATLLSIGLLALLPRRFESIAYEDAAILKGYLENSETR
ncbi:MFS transporter [Azospirillum sp. TSO35-2]|uniref:MFS transporter n=1 Tax=Azospirillum sp. TSO35-2 TaxID=716796 RepID=UPI001304E2B8|nr:MFS transporter [Azospirillum sp. TSO35-2]